MLCALALLSGCGGGGSDKTDSPSAAESVTKVIGSPGAGPSINMTFPSDGYVATGVEGTQGDATIRAQITYTGVDQFWLKIDEQIGLIRSGEGAFYSATDFIAQARLRSDLPAGDYETQLIFHACKDEACTEEIPGSPVKQRLVYTVLPNLKVQPSVKLSRQGREPAPSITLPVTVPPAAGGLTATVTTLQSQAFDIRLDGNQLVVNTQQVRAGQYDADVLVFSQTDPRYAKHVSVSYTVSAPTGGEQDIAVSPQFSYLSTRQGQTISQRIKFTRPSWTSAWNAPRLMDVDPRASLKDLGHDEYELIYNAAGVATGTYNARITADAGPLAGSITAQVYVNVDQPFGAGLMFKTIDESTSDLTASTQVFTLDQQPANWTASTSAPWLRLIRASGVTERDALVVEIDRSYLATVGSQAGEIQIAIDRAGVNPITTQLMVYNNLVKLIRPVNASFTGTSARLFIESNYLTDPLKVTGARVVGQTPMSDTRMLGNATVIALDLTDITPGTPIQVEHESKWLPTSVTFETYARPLVPTGQVTLPQSPRRAPHFSVPYRSLYLASPGVVYRWAHDGSTWAPVQQAFVNGLIDVTLSADGRRLYGTTAQGVVQLDPMSLNIIRTASMGPRSFVTFAANPWNGLNALTTTADGRIMASLISDFGGRGIGWIRSDANTAVDDPMTSPTTGDPGNETRSFSAAWPNDTGSLRSPDGQVVVGMQPNGSTRQYLSWTRTWNDFFAIPPGTQLAALADDGKTYMLSNGVLVSEGVAQGASLENLLPAGYLAGGYGLSGDGSRAYIYGYKVDRSGATPVVTDAAVWMVDIHDRANTPLDQSPISKIQSLSKPVGCLSPLATGESCEHTATLTMAPGNRSLFISGPRGIAALTVPDYTLVAQPSRTIAHPQSLSAKPKRTWSRTTLISK